VVNDNAVCSGHLSEGETVTLEAEVDTIEVSSKASESAMSLDDILSADSEGSKLHLEGLSDEVGQKQKLVSGYATMLNSSSVLLCIIIFSVFVAMLEIGKLLFWQAWAKVEASEEIAGRFHELIPDLALEFPFELDAFQKKVITSLIIFLLVTTVP